MSFNNFFHSEWPWFLLLGVMVLILFVLEYIEKGHGLKVLSMQEAIRLLNNPKATALDLRAGSDFNGGHIPNTKNTSRALLEKDPQALIKKKENPILLICEHNHQARQAGKALKKQGYTDVHILEGGLATWRKENLPLEV